MLKARFKRKLLGIKGKCILKYTIKNNIPTLKVIFLLIFFVVDFIILILKVIFFTFFKKIIKDKYGKRVAYYHKLSMRNMRKIMKSIKFVITRKKYGKFRSKEAKILALINNANI